MLRDASPRPNNQDALVYALWLLGGADRDVDVEDIYLKCFEIAPARLGWRTRADLPDYKKTSKALQSVEAKELPGLLGRTDALHRRLTPAGVEWVQRNLPTLEANYGGHRPVAGTTSGAHERTRRRLLSSSAFTGYRASKTPDLMQLAEAFECSPGSQWDVWASRFDGGARAAQVLQDDELRQFVEWARAMIEERKR